MIEDDIEICRKIGEYGEALIKDGDGILTHCNAGSLAAVRYGTALAPIYIDAVNYGSVLHGESNVRVLYVSNNLAGIVTTRQE